MWIKTVVLVCVVALGTVAMPSLAQSTVSEDVKKAQESLKEKGYYKGEVDGILGPQTRAALHSYQAKENLTANGRFTAETAKSLGIDRETPGEHFEDAGAAVKKDYSKAGEKVTEGSKEAGHEMKKGEVTESAVQMGKGVGGGAKAVGKGTGKAAKSVGKGVKDVFDRDEDRPKK